MRPPPPLQEYEGAIEARNYTGICMIDRNDELCILYEKANIQEDVMKKGEALSSPSLVGAAQRPACKSSSSLTPPDGVCWPQLPLLRAVRRLQAQSLGKLMQSCMPIRHFHIRGASQVCSSTVQCQAETQGLANSMQAVIPQAR